jgi:hypothetical protein
MGKRLSANRKVHSYLKLAIFLLFFSIEPVNASEWNFETVMCYVKNKDQLNFLLEKSKGDQVTIKGKVISVGEVLGYSLKIDFIE